MGFVELVTVSGSILALGYIAVRMLLLDVRTDPEALCETRIGEVENLER